VKPVPVLQIHHYRELQMSPEARHNRFRFHALSEQLYDLPVS